MSEAGKRKLESRLLDEAKKFRSRIAKEVATLKAQGRRLAVELKKMATESARRRRTRDQALAKIAALRAEVTRKTEELRRKSAELTRLAQDSAERARAILGGERLSAPEAAAEPAPPQPPPEIPPANSET